MPRSKAKVPTVRVTGPLAPYAAEFTHELTARGYAPSTRTGHLRVMTHLSRWLQARQLSVTDLSTEWVEEYLAGRGTAGYSSFRTRAGLARLLGVLASHGAPLHPTPAGTTAASSRADALLDGYERFLCEECGLASSTVSAYLLRARRFLNDYTDDADLRTVTTATVSEAVLAEARGSSASATRMFAIALRWLLRYAHLEGLIAADLSTAVLPLTGRPRSPLPRGISPAGATALLRTCDRRTAIGRRDYAVILILLRLGLRAGEVAGLRLADLDWRAGQITVAGKGHRLDPLPLPADVGEAIAAYLHRGRPVTAGRGMFLATNAPHAALSRSGVSWIVHRACAQAGLPPVGAHALRHGLACRLLRAGAPLGEIGQLLRQHADITVSVYARVDVDRLRTITLPWPGSPSGSAR